MKSLSEVLVPGVEVVYSVYPFSYKAIVVEVNTADFLVVAYKEGGTRMPLCFDSIDLVNSNGVEVWDRKKAEVSYIMVGDGVTIRRGSKEIHRVVIGIKGGQFEVCCLSGNRELVAKREVVYVWRYGRLLFSRDVIKEQHARAEVDREALERKIWDRAYPGRHNTCDEADDIAKRPFIGKICSTPDYESFQRKMDELKKELE